MAWNHVLERWTGIPAGLISHCAVVHDPDWRSALDAAFNGAVAVRRYMPGDITGMIYDPVIVGPIYDRDRHIVGTLAILQLPEENHHRAPILEESSR